MSSPNSPRNKKRKKKYWQLGVEKGRRMREKRGRGEWRGKRWKKDPTKNVDTG